MYVYTLYDSWPLARHHGPGTLLQPEEEEDDGDEDEEEEEEAGEWHYSAANRQTSNHKTCPLGDARVGDLEEYILSFTHSPFGALFPPFYDL